MLNALSITRHSNLCRRVRWSSWGWPASADYRSEPSSHFASNTSAYLDSLSNISTHTSINHSQRVTKDMPQVRRIANSFHVVFQIEMGVNARKATFAFVNANAFASCEQTSSVRKFDLQCYHWEMYLSLGISNSIVFQAYLRNFTRVDAVGGVVVDVVKRCWITIRNGFYLTYYLPICQTHHLTFLSCDQKI